MVNNKIYLKYVIYYTVYIIFLHIIVNYLFTNYANFFIAIIKLFHINKDITIIILLILQYIIFLLPLIIRCKKGVFGNCKKYFIEKVKRLGFKNLLIYVIGGYILTIFVINFVYFLISLLNILGIHIPIFGNKENTVEIINKLVKHGGIIMEVIMFITVIIVGPLIEEIIYRSFITEFLLKRKNSIISIVLGSFIFALVHFEWNVLGYLFILGLYLGFIRYKTRSLIYTFLAHSLVNFITFLILNFIY